MILAAGLGTRLKPWTDAHPKALVPVGGVPMLGRVITRLKEEGFDDIVINVHHFSDQIMDYLKKEIPEDVRIGVSDESDELLDTGGGLIYASPQLFRDDRAVLVHNVDILSDAALRQLMEAHAESGDGATLLVSERESSRKLYFDRDMKLKGWHDSRSDHYRPEGFRPEAEDREYAFSGIYVISEEAVDEMRRLFAGRRVFPIMDYFLSPGRRLSIGGIVGTDLHVIDIGKPATLSQADKLFR